MPDEANSISRSVNWLQKLSMLVTVPPVNVTPLQVAAAPTQQESNDAMPDFGDSCMDFDFIGG